MASQVMAKAAKGRTRKAKEKMEKGKVKVVARANRGRPRTGDPMARATKVKKPFAQNVTPGFACTLLRAQDQLCSANQSLFGKGDCSGCVAWVQWAARYYGPRCQDSLNPLRHALLLGYERSMLHTMQTHPALYIDALSNSVRAPMHLQNGLQRP